MSDRSRSPRGAFVRTEADLREADLRAALAHAIEVGEALDDARTELAAERAAVAAAKDALAAERARAAAERDTAADIRRLLRDALNSMTRDIRELAAIAHRAGASHDLVDYWYDGPPPPSEPEAEPDPQ